MNQRNKKLVSFAFNDPTAMNRAVNQDFFMKKGLGIRGKVLKRVHVEPVTTPNSRCAVLGSEAVRGDMSDAESPATHEPGHIIKVSTGVRAEPETPRLGGALRGSWKSRIRVCRHAHLRRLLHTELTLRFWIDSTCGVTLGMIYMACSEKVRSLHAERHTVLGSDSCHWHWFGWTPWTCEPIGLLE